MPDNDHPNVRRNARTDRPMLLTIKQAAIELSLCARSVRRAINRGEITIVSLGKGAKGDRIEQDELDRYVNSKRVTRVGDQPRDIKPGSLREFFASAEAARKIARQEKSKKEPGVKHPERTKTRRILNAAVRKNEIQKFPCWTCDELKVDGHHPDYQEPLSVVWLCRKHHQEVHEMIKYA